MKDLEYLEQTNRAQGHVKMDVHSICYVALRLFSRIDINLAELNEILLVVDGCFPNRFNLYEAIKKWKGISEGGDGEGSIFQFCFNKRCEAYGL